ncbi:MAG TPA: hypothetical protein VGF25_02585 [Thermoleophilaceae bacterium]|jgi:hypothetical protein
MRRLAVVAVVALVPLAIAAPAAAKEAVKAKVCGKSDCVETKDRGILAVFQEGGPPSEPPQAGAAWYRVRMTIDIGDGNRDSFPMVVAPRARVAGSADPGGAYQWYELTPAAAKAFTGLARGLEAFPPSRFPARDSSPPAARVDEVVEPPQPAGSSDGSAWPWLLGAAAVGLAGAGAFALVRRGRRPRPDSTGPDPATP